MSHQSDLFSGEARWFHVFKSMIDSGDLARLHGSSIKVYLVIKAHTNFQTGNALPAISTIAEKAGISVAQVKRELRTLENMGYLTRTKQGRNNVYGLREKIEISDEHGRTAAVASWDYIPAGVQEAIADLRNVLVSGDLGNARVVHIERLNIQVNNGASTGVQINIQDLERLEKSNPKLLAKLLAIKAKSEG